MRMWIQLILLGVLTQSSVWGRDVLLVAKGGVSSYGSVYIGNFGGGGGDQNWNSGPIVGLGIRLRETDAFALEGMVEYSTHSYDPTEYETPPINDPKNKILDISITPRFSIPVLEGAFLLIFGGISISSQHKDEFVEPSPDGPYSTNPTNLTGVSGIVGTGVEVRLTSRLELSVEGSLRMRKYVTPVVELGVAFSL